ncbi:MAG TPA: hypothetical protein VGR89_00730 [Puia sp.]|nr:hypothetical protein [Puia sp.]
MHRYYGDGVHPIFGTETYEKPISWLLEECESIEDWGCGMAWGKRYAEGRYKGIDGSPDAARYADVISDLRDYTSDTDGIFMRHILEHNLDWEVILGNIMKSFRKRFALVLFTPFSEKTHPMVPHGLYDLSFAKGDIMRFFEGCRVTGETLVTDTQYQIEHIFYVEKL